MSALRLVRGPLIVGCFALGLIALAGGALRTGFLNDDYLFLEQARSQPLARALLGTDALGNYYRPLSRPVYFAALTAWSHGSPRFFHVFNFALFLVALALLADLLRGLFPPASTPTAAPAAGRGHPVLAGTLYFALLPFQRVAWLWISCSQDLLALVFALAAFALFRRSRRLPAAFLFVAALASKESALALPAGLMGWEVLIARRTLRDAARRVLPFAAVALVWGTLALSISRHGSGARLLHFDPGTFLASYAHQAQSLLGLAHPAGMVAALATHGPNPLALALFAAIALLLPARREALPGDHPAAPPATGTPAPTPPPTAAAVAGFGALWLITAGLIPGPLAASWSAYYYMMSGVGAAALFGLATRAIGRWGWPLLAGALLWWHAGGTAVRAFAVEDRPWGWTSHLTSYYFERAATLTGTLSRQLLELEPAPPRGTRFFFATLPPWAGFQMGSGALVRELYRDPSLESWYYSQYSETTAADRPCRFFYWDGRALRPLYAHAADPGFQVGSDLLLLNRPAGAAHAFRRGLAAGGERSDLLYWLGWSELWRGRRREAEAAWLEFGARDDSLRWATEIVSANHALASRDTLGARRHLAAALYTGIGRPLAHAVLGELLLGSQPKYALLELSVAVWLNPEDLRTRRLLTAGLARARLDDSALRNLEAIEARDVLWRSDPELVRLDTSLRKGAAQGSGGATVLAPPAP